MFGQSSRLDSPGSVGPSARASSAFGAASFRAALSADATPRHPPPRIPRRPRTWRCHKQGRYHHGLLAESAVQRGLVVAAQLGPMGVTVSGIARDLGVSRAAINYFFHNRAGLRAAIANAAATQMRPFCVFRSGGQRAAATLQKSARSWVDYAAQHPNLYRMVFGEGWRDDYCKTLVRHEALHSIDRVANIGQMSGHIRPGATRDHSWFLWSAMHGLAMSCADGVTSPPKVAPLIDRFVRELAPTGA